MKKQKNMNAQNVKMVIFSLLMIIFANLLLKLIYLIIVKKLNQLKLKLLQNILVLVAAIITLIYH